MILTLLKVYVMLSMELNNGNESNNTEKDFFLKKKKGNLKRKI